jgi:zinc protease
MESVRDRRGLTYGIGAGLDVLMGGVVVQGAVATDNATAGEVWTLVRQAWQKMAEPGPTEEETADDAAALSGALPQRFADSRGRHRPS